MVSQHLEMGSSCTWGRSLPALQHLKVGSPCSCTWEQDLPGLKPRPCSRPTWGCGEGMAWYRAHPAACCSQVCGSFLLQRGMDGRKILAHLRASTCKVKCPAGPCGRSPCPSHMTQGLRGVQGQDPPVSPCPPGGLEGCPRILPMSPTPGEGRRGHHQPVCKGERCRAPRASS